jgi:copper chaperone CopZ
MPTVTYSVPNISCNHCVHTIKTELGELPGVKTVTADASTKQVTVSYEPPATPLEMEKLLAEIDYPVAK